MAYINNEDVVAFRDEGQVLCLECVSNYQPKCSEEIITQDEYDKFEGYITCDECDKII